MFTISSVYTNYVILIHHLFICNGILHGNEKGLPHARTWLNLKAIMSNERSQTWEIRYCMNPSILWSRSEASCLLGLGIDWIGAGGGVLWSSGNVLCLTKVVVIRVNTYVKIHWAVCSLKICTLYLNRIVNNNVKNTPTKTFKKVFLFSKFSSLQITSIITVFGEPFQGYFVQV